MRFRSTSYRFLIGLLLVVLESFAISEPDFCEKPDGSPGTCEHISPGTVAYDKLVQRFLNKHGMKRHLEEVCIEADVCYNVEDWIYSEQLYRLMISDKYIISGALLEIPKVIDDEMDTSKWSIDKGKLRFDSYTTAMIEEMFTSGAVEISRDAEAQVLFVGMGAGFMNTYIHHVYPKINITAVDIEPKMLKTATKWFGLEQDERHRVIIEDGVEFLRRAVKNGHKYDAILIDVCTVDYTLEILCPRQEFSNKEITDHLSALITEKGVVVHNILTKKVDRKLPDKVKSDYKRSFRYCLSYLSPFNSHSVNTVLACTNVKRPNELRGKYVKFAGYPKKFYQPYDIKY